MRILGTGLAARTSGGTQRRRARLDGLTCPNCYRLLAEEAGILRCSSHHSFDVARQGYVTLMTGRGATTASDTADMVAARARFQGAGYYQPIVDAVRSALPSDPESLLDIGCGTGYYLASVAPTATRTIGLDLSKFAARAAARVLDTAVVADVWHHIPIEDSSVDAITCIFAPRNPKEFARVLRPKGKVIVVTPRTGHLSDVAECLPMVSVATDKADRLADSFGQYFERLAQRSLSFAMCLDAQSLHDVVMMGPSAFHASSDDVMLKVARLPTPFTVEASVDISEFVFS